MDCVVETDGHVYIFEFKLAGSAEAALCQIDKHGHARPIGTSKRKLYKVCVKFSSKTGIIDGW